MSEDIAVKALKFLLARAPRNDRVVDHSLRVGGQFDDMTARTVGYLHDLVEDGHATDEEIGLLFGDEVQDLVYFLTREDDETYYEYVRAIPLGGRIAVLVKLADLADNLRNMPKEKESLRPRYLEAQKFLRESLADL